MALFASGSERFPIVGEVVNRLAWFATQSNLDSKGRLRLPSSEVANDLTSHPNTFAAPLSLVGTAFNSPSERGEEIGKGDVHLHRLPRQNTSQPLVIHGYLTVYYDERDAFGELLGVFECGAVGDTVGVEDNDVCELAHCDLAAIFESEA